jgi:hypothetical protein
MAGLLADLIVATQLGAKTVSRRLHSQVEPPPALDEFRAGLQSLIESAPPSLIQGSHWLTIPATQPPWVETQITLQPGEQISYFVAGRIYANRLLDIYINPSLQLWARVGEEGPIFRGTRNSHSFTAQTPGQLYFGNYFPNDWADSQGTRVQSDDVYGDVSGELGVLVIRWSGSALKGLQTLVANGDYHNLLHTEIERIEQGDTTPQGWKYLWHLGPAEIYRDSASVGGVPCIHCHTNADVGILQKPADMPLQPGTLLSWRWCVAQLPSSLREDTVPSHDYLSIAVEFDNGRDITYYWSGSLAPETGYDCPLPNWHGKEYHVVVRCGSEGLGEWQTEQRDLYADYQHFMGEPPARIVSVWLIANSIFQRQPGSCDYADIVLSNKDNKIRVL